MEARASGKVILLGEHAVVYGVPAIAVGIQRGAVARVTPLAGDAKRPSELYVMGFDLPILDTDETRDLGRAFRAVLDATLGKNRAPVRVDASAELPPGGGLGCSAALGVAITRALDGSASLEVVRERAMAWERIFHGNPSGIDTAVAAHGGFVYFQRGEPLEVLSVRSSLDLCIGYSGVGSSTKTMVESVAALRERRPDMVAKAFAGIESLVRNARLAAEAGDRKALGTLMDLNQMILSGLFVSSFELERLCGVAREAGALGAKLTGAGGGGCVVALAESREAGERVLEAWRLAGFDGFATTAGFTEARETERVRAPAMGESGELSP